MLLFGMCKFLDRKIKYSSVFSKNHTPSGARGVISVTRNR